MKALKLIINGEEQALCNCSNGVVIPVVSTLPSNPTEGQMVIDSTDSYLKVYYNSNRYNVELLGTQNNT